MRGWVLTTLVAGGCVGIQAYKPDPEVTDTAVTDTDDASVADTDDTSDTDDTEVIDTDDSAVDGTGDTDVRDTDPPLVSRAPIIVEVADGQSGPWKFVEIHNPGDTVITLTGYALHRYSNGQGPPSPPNGVWDFPGDAINPGSTYVVGFAGSSPQSAFITAFGRPAHAWSTAVDGNGDDVYQLLSGTRIIDVYGVAGVDGTGTAWDYTDSSAVRNAGILSGNVAFDAAEWTIQDASLAEPFTR